MGCSLISHFTARNTHLPVNYFTEAAPEKEIKQSKNQEVNISYLERNHRHNEASSKENFTKLLGLW